jgi:transcriptional regulator with XRE-family HTH domain
LAKFQSTAIIAVGSYVMPNRSIFHSNEEDTTLGGRISMAREVSGLSVGQVVKRLGVKATTYKGWEADRSEPRANKLVALAGILNVSPPYLLSGLGKQPSRVGLPERQINQLSLEIEQLEKSLKLAMTSLRQIKRVVAKMK